MDIIIMTILVAMLSIWTGDLLIDALTDWGIDLNLYPVDEEDFYFHLPEGWVIESLDLNSINLLQHELKELGASIQSISPDGSEVVVSWRQKTSLRL